MLLIATLVLGVQRPPADEVMKSMLAHYQRLKSYSAKIIHHGDFLSESKESTDTLSWLAPKRFEIVSNKDSSPKISSNGKRVATFVLQGVPILEDLTQGQHIPAWEPRGGIVLSLLMRGQLADQLLHPEKPLKVSYSYGKDLKWHDVPVSQIEGKLTAPGFTETINYYLSPDCKQIVGLEVITGDRSVWTQYTEVQENPLLPKWLGDLPKTSGESPN